MLRRKFNSIFRKQFVKYLSVNPSPSIEDEKNELSEEFFKKNIKEKEVLQSPDYFSVHNLFTVKDLFDAKVHYGHKDVSVNRNMKPFVFGSRLGQIIFDLDKTAYHLREALNFTAHVAYRDGIILFISKNPRMTLLVENTARDCKEFAVAREWTFGTLTDGINRKSFMRLPDLCIFLNTLEENGYQHLGVLEAAKMCIPTVGIVDSNCNPNLITYPVPGNDDSLSCFQLYCKLFKEAILRGKNERLKHSVKNIEAGSAENMKTDAIHEEIIKNLKANAIHEESIKNLKKDAIHEETIKNVKTESNFEETAKTTESVLSSEKTVKTIKDKESKDTSNVIDIINDFEVSSKTHEDLDK